MIETKPTPAPQQQPPQQPQQRNSNAPGDAASAATALSKARWSKFSGKGSLRSVLVVPFVLQIFAAVGLTGWLSLRNGQQAVNEVATQLRTETTERIKQHLESYLELPHVINQLNADAFANGELTIENHEGIERHFARQINLFDSVSYIYMGSTQGGIIAPGRRQDGSLVIEATDDFAAGDYNIYAANHQGERTERLSATPNYDARFRPWYRAGVASQKPSWGGIYVYFAEQVSGIPAVYPLHDAAGKFQGVLAVDLILSHIGQFLQDLDIGRSGQSFILERSGLVVASSMAEDIFTRDGESKSLRRINAIESEDPLLRNAAASLQQKFGALSAIATPVQLEFTLDSELYSGRQFLQVTPFSDQRGLDWLVVVIVPEDDFMGKIHANRQTTLWLCLASLLVATSLGILTARWITGPILRLNQASQAIAQGELTQQQISVKGIYELETLADSFNAMVGQLNTSFAALEKANADLEQRVEERTLELTTAKEIAEAANQAKTKFLSRMSHELRTPLNAILGFAQVMKADADLDPKFQNYIDIIDRSGEHLLELVNDVLSMSKIEAGEIQFREAAFALYPFLENLRDLFILRATAKGLTLQLDLEPNLPTWIITDEAKLRQVLINLVGNAIKFTTTGSITLGTATSRSCEDKTDPRIHLQFCVEDTGEGIPEADIPRLFDAFTQGNIQTSSQEGTGLGLPISQQFVKLMGGKLKLSSVVGEGTRCEFCIPVERAAQAEEADPAGQAIQPAEASPLGKIIGLAPGQDTYRILIVEDDRVSRLLLLKVLRPLGFETQEAANGEEAIALWQTWRPHLIFMDMQMPVMDGDEATQKIRQAIAAETQVSDPEHLGPHLPDSSTPELPSRGPDPIIIALTASAFETDRDRSLTSGCNDFMGKPFRREILLEKIAQHLGVNYRYANE